MRFTLYILATIILTSCDNRKESSGIPIKSKNLNDSIKNIIIADTITKIEFPEPISIKQLLSSVRQTTSGVLGTAGTEDFCNPNKEYFFGFYFLIDDRGLAPFGKLTIYLPKRPKTWLFADPNEKFVEIELNSNEVQVWDSIGVGVKEKDLLKFIGKNFHYKKGTSIYSELGEYSATFTIIADTVNKLKVGKYCNTKE